MPSITITNPDIDQEAAALIAKAYEMITPHWRELIPPLTIMIANQPFNQIPELHGFCEIQNKEPGWEASQWKSVQVICPEIEEGKAVLWIRYDRHSLMHPRDYYFHKAFFAVIGKVVWFTSKKVRDEARKNATGFAAQSGGAIYMAFRDTFSRFFLNPEWLQERREDAWNFMLRIDRALSAA